MKRAETTTGAETLIGTARDMKTQEVILPAITREYVHSIRGMFKGKGLLKALMDDRKHQRES